MLVIWGVAALLHLRDYKYDYVSLERKQLAENSTVYVQFLDNQMLLTSVRLNSPSHICNHVNATKLQPLKSLA